MVIGMCPGSVSIIVPTLEVCLNVTFAFVLVETTSPMTSDWTITQERPQVTSGVACRMDGHQTMLIAQ